MITYPLAVTGFLVVLVVLAFASACLEHYAVKNASKDSLEWLFRFGFNWGVASTLILVLGIVCLILAAYAP